MTNRLLAILTGEKPVPPTMTDLLDPDPFGALDDIVQSNDWSLRHA